MTEPMSVEHYYELILPEQFAAAMADATPDIIAQPPISSTYAVRGEGGSVIGLRVANGQLELVPGGIPDSDLYTTISVDEWRSAVASSDEPLFRYVTRGKVAAAKNLRGTLKLDIERTDGSSFTSQTVYGGATDPQVTIHTSSDNYKALMNGSLNGQMAFLTGKITFDGSLAFLLQLAGTSF